MNNVIQVADEVTLDTLKRQRQLRNTVGFALGRAYPRHPWHVLVPEDCSIVQVSCPALTSKYGMVIHANRTSQDLAQRAVKMAGELLERFGVSRERAEFGYVKRNIAGEAVGAAQGEQ